MFNNTNCATKQLSPRPDGAALRNFSPPRQTSRSTARSPNRFSGAAPTPTAKDPKQVLDTAFFLV
jgi:hypothetical protein